MSCHVFPLSLPPALLGENVFFNFSLIKTRSLPSVRIMIALKTKKNNLIKQQIRARNIKTMSFNFSKTIVLAS